jgi:tRNA(adenine34) deaminase
LGAKDISGNLISLDSKKYSDLYWMEMALSEAALSGDDVPVGALLIRGEEILAKAHNQKEKSQDPTDHAEIIVIRQACAAQNNWRLDGTTLYTTLEPCPICAETIMQSRVSRLVFGAYDANSGAVGSKFNLFVTGRPYPIPQVSSGIMQEECQELLQAFFRVRRKVK